MSPEINNGVESCTICVLWRVTKAPPQACTRPSWPDLPFMSSVSLRPYQKNLHDESALSPLSSFSPAYYTRERLLLVSGWKKEKEKKKEKRKRERKKKKEREEMGAGAFVLPAFYLGSACSRACGRSLPAVYEGRKQWPR